MHLDFSVEKEHLTNGILSDIWENILRKEFPMSDPNHLHELHGRRGYDPNQPRVPAGQSTGGQWTDTNGPNDGAPPRKVVRDSSGQEAWNFYNNMYRPDGSLAEQVVFNRDRSRIVSEYNEAGGADGWDERHTVITPDGNKFTFEDRGDNQIAYVGGDADGRPSETASTEQGAEERPIVQKAFLPAVAAPAVIGVGEGLGIAAAGLALLTWLSRRNRREGTYVLSFPTDLLLRADAENLRRVQVARLTEEELVKACDKYGHVQTLTNKAAAAARLEPKDWRPSSFGTEVHKRVAHIVNSGSDEAPSEPPSPNEPKNHNFRAEMSALKIEAALRADAVHRADTRLSAELPVKPETGAPAVRLPGYGEPDTVRVDVFENQPEKRTVASTTSRPARSSFISPE
jgi:hypothetical protein